MQTIKVKQAWTGISCDDLSVWYVKLSEIVKTQTTTQQNFNAVVGLDIEMTWQTTPTPQKLSRSLQEPQINIYWPQLDLQQKAGP